MKNEFVCGFVCACSVILRNHGNESEIEEALAGVYTSREQLMSDGVDPHDIEILEPILKEIDRKRKYDH